LVPTIGSSGAIFGILMAYAVLYPTRTILFGFLIPIQVKYFVMIIGAIAFISSFQVNSGVSEFAHLGGLLFGYLFLKTPKNLQFDLVGPVRRQYSDWKLRRAKKKFQVYLRKQGSSRDPRVH
jgi:membrane associated rhomboid family serine protease